MAPLNNHGECPLPLSLQSLTVLSSEPLANHCPLGLKATEFTGPKCLRKVLIARSVAINQSLIVPFLNPLARSSPSVMRSMGQTAPKYVPNMQTSFPASTDHSLIVLSFEPLATNFPSGLRAPEEISSAARLPTFCRTG